MLQRVISIVSITVLLLPAYFLKAQRSNPSDLFANFSKYYASGDFLNAEKCLLVVIKSKDSINSGYVIAAYNNLGVINNRFGRYEEALRYYNLAEIKNANKEQDLQELADIYINKAMIYGILKESDKAIEYLEQGVKIYLSINNPNLSIYSRLSSAYNNLGLTYYERKEYKTALLYLEKSQAIKVKYDLPEIAFTYLNIAKTYVKISNPEKAQDYFLWSIESFKQEFNQGYYRLADVYFDFGLFLRSIGRNQEAFEIHRKALSICLKNYGRKHPFVSLAYKHLGDYFFNQGEYNSALRYYQKSLIAVVSDFNDTSIYSNPSLNSVIFDIRLLDNLKRKSQALELFSQQQENLKMKQEIMGKSYETIGLALQLIGRIRSGYVTTESQIYLAENEKETYMFATHIAQRLYELTKKDEYLQRMYSIACISKSAVLRNEIAENELLYRKGSTDTLLDKHTKLLVNIASYSKLIQDELQKTKPDTLKIDFWKDALFELNRSKERIAEKIKELYPQYDALTQKAEPLSLKEIQNHLKKDETLVEYFLSNHYSEGKRKLYIFTITQSSLNYHITDLDSLFAYRVEFIKQGTVNAYMSSNSAGIFQTYTDALYYMYEKLIKPVESSIVGRKLIIIPDEEIAYLPFDAFIRKKPNLDQVSYEELQYLIYDYSISYGYTSSLIFKKGNKKQISEIVYAFSPDYGKQEKGVRKNLRNLQGAGKEIGSIFKWFKGKAYYGEKASENNFKSLVKQPTIFHLAMHSQQDSTNSKYSYLIFDNQMDTIEDGKLFNYEISMSRIESPMVVLSSCNTGTGNLYHGEGVMSLTRGFILAGASSVINTFWDVNDDASAKIMMDFYYQLSKGYEKDVALRMAKLNYLKSTPPTYANPYYWAAYEIMGDKSPIKKGVMGYFFSIGAFLLIGVALYACYFRWLRRS